MKDMEPFEKVIVFGLKAKLSGFWVPDEYIADFVTKAPSKLVGFASCDPTQANYVEELKHSIQTLKLVGLKMGPMYAGFDPRDKICDPVYSYCQERHIPIIFHTGTSFIRAARLSYSRPWLFDEVALRYPKLLIVLAHLAHPYYAECIAVIRKHPNVFADISALFYRPWQFYNMMIAVQEYNVAHKILFGTDYPFASSLESISGLKSVNNLVRNTNLPHVSEKVVQEILERDAFDLIGL